MTAGSGRKGHLREGWQALQTHTGVKWDGGRGGWRVKGSVVRQLRTWRLADRWGEPWKVLKAQVISSGMDLEGPIWWECVGRPEERKANVEAIEKVQGMNRKDEKMKEPTSLKRIMHRIWRCTGNKKSLEGFLCLFACFRWSGSSAACVFYLTCN